MIEEIKAACRTKNYEFGELIFKKGSSANFLYILEQGDIDLLLKEEDQTIFLHKNHPKIYGIYDTLNDTVN